MEKSPDLRFAEDIINSILDEGELDYQDIKRLAIALALELGKYSERRYLEGISEGLRRAETSFNKVMDKFDHE